MPTKINDGFLWKKKEDDFLRKDARDHYTMKSATDRLNRRFHARKKVGRTMAAVGNRVRSLGIKFSGKARGPKTHWVPTKKIIADVNKMLIEGKTKNEIILHYSEDWKIPVVQFRRWITKVKGRRSLRRIETVRSATELESIYTDRLSGMTLRNIAIKRGITDSAVGSIISNWIGKRRNIMTSIIKGDTVTDIRLRFGITIEELGEFRRLARHMDVAGVDDELADEPIWTMPEMQGAQDAIIANKKNMVAFMSEVRYTEKNIVTDLKYILVLCSGDWHFESIYTDQEKLIEHIDLVQKTEGVYSVFVGDATDDGYVSPHKDLLLDSAGSTKMARAATRGLFFKIKRKLLLMTDGCHVKWTKKAADYSPYEEYAKQMDVPYFGPGGTIKLSFGDISYRIHARHIFRGGRKDILAAPRTYIQEEDPECDVAIVGHNHVNAISTLDWAGKQRVFVRSGSYKDVDTYAKEFGFSSQETRTPPCIIFNTRTSGMRIERSLEEGIETMEALNRGSKK